MTDGYVHDAGSTSDPHDDGRFARLERDRRAAADLRPALRAAATVARPRLGWALAALGVLALIVAWVGVSDEIFVSRQVPYIVSGGLGGVAMIVLAGVLLGTHDLYQYADRLDRLERKVDDIHRVLVVAWDDVAAQAGGQTIVMLPGGTTYHRPTCAAVRGKSVEHVALDRVVNLGMSPCKLCEPETPVASLTG